VCPEPRLETGDRRVQEISLLKKAHTYEAPARCQMTAYETNVKIKWTTVLTEVGPIRPDGDPQTFGRGEGVDVFRTREKVRVAMERIRCTLALLRCPCHNDQSNHLDRFTTNVLEPCSPDAVQCDKCLTQHIAGYCLEQWVTYIAVNTLLQDLRCLALVKDKSLRQSSSTN
jgi:hypothetical protein